MLRTKKGLYLKESWKSQKVVILPFRKSKVTIMIHLKPIWSWPLTVHPNRLATPFNLGGPKKGDHSWSLHLLLNRHLFVIVRLFCGDPTALSGVVVSTEELQERLFHFSIEIRLLDIHRTVLLHSNLDELLSLTIRFWCDVIPLSTMKRPSIIRHVTVGQRTPLITSKHYYNTCCCKNSRIIPSDTDGRQMAT